MSVPLAVSFLPPHPWQLVALENVTDSRCAIFKLELVERWVPNLRLNLLGNSWPSDALSSLLRVCCQVITLRCGVGYISL